MLPDNVFHVLVSAGDRIDRHRIITTFVVMLFVLLIADILAFNFADMKTSVSGSPAEAGQIYQAALSLMDFAPEVWVGILALVLGTLVIVISIASQNTPKLIELYMRDRTSLMYVWFISLTLVHNLLLQFDVGAWGSGRASSIILSTGLFLPLSGLLAVPYIFYILGLTRPDQVIRRIDSENLDHIRRLASQPLKRALVKPGIAARHQELLFDVLNQLDDLLEYLRFKEPKGNIIRAVGSATQLFVRLKKRMPVEFFRVSEAIRDDISFKTLAGQYDEIEAERTFYSQKAFRLLGNAYMHFLDRGDFELSTLCVIQVGEIGRVALDESDDAMVGLTITRFNTLLRFGIKHGTRQTELRNLYNSIDQYGAFIRAAARLGKTEDLKKASIYLKSYGTEIYRISRDIRAFEFLVDVVAAELRAILITAAETGTPVDVQRQILEQMLQLDSVPEIDKSDLHTTSIVYDKVRVLQVSLALYYLRNNQQEFTDMIVSDILKDFAYVDESQLRDAMKETIQTLECAPPRFWEDTDRGNQNIFYSPDTEFLPDFIDRFEQALTSLVNPKKV